MLDQDKIQNTPHAEQDKNFVLDFLESNHAIKFMEKCNLLRI